VEKPDYIAPIANINKAPHVKHELLKRSSGYIFAELTFG
jgi:hypothetical protein